jgi:hypothetical protein
MDDEKKLIIPHTNFPFNQLVLDPNIQHVKGAKEGDIHVNMFILENNKYKKFAIAFKCSLSTYSITYYIGKADNEGKKPSLYLHPILHPHWSDTDKNGKIIQKVSHSGDEIEDFFKKYKERVELLLFNLDREIRESILGPVNCRKEKDFIDDVVNFPIKDNKLNMSQSKTFGVKLFIVDAMDQTKKYNKTKKNDHIMIPDTGYKIFSQIYDISKTSKTGNARILNYNDFKPFVYSANSHLFPNASGSRLKMDISLTINSPTLHTKKNDANIQVAAQRIVITSYKSSTAVKSLNQDEIDDIRKERQEAKEEHGSNSTDNESSTEDIFNEPQDGIPASQLLSDQNSQLPGSPNSQFPNEDEPVDDMIPDKSRYTINKRKNTFADNNNFKKRKIVK